MAEERIRIEGVDKNGIYGMYNNNGNKRLVMHFHGMTHQSHDLLEVTSRRYFKDNGYDHYRINFYASDTDSRKLRTSTLSTHVHDIHSAVDYFQGKYDEVFITAHSLSGLCMLIANPKNIKAMSLWDPSTDVTNFWATSPHYLTYLEDRKEYILDYGNTFLISEAMVEEIKDYPDETCLELASQISTPTQFIIPEISIFSASPHISPENYKDKFKGPFDLQYIDDTDHVFEPPGARHKLMEATHKFLNKYSCG